MYQCSRCGHMMSYPLERCPSCGVLLSGVKCEACRYVGAKSEFISNGHRCPKCNSSVYVPGGGIYSSTPSIPAPPPPPPKTFCPFCKAEVPEAATECNVCGKPRSHILGANKLQSVAKTFLVSGILNIIVGLCISTVLGLTLIFPIFLGMLIMLLGAWEIVNAYLFWYTPPKAAWSPKHVAFFEMAAFLFGPIWNIAFGIVNLTRLGDPNIQSHLDNLYRDEPLKPKRANRLLTAWILIVLGGLSTLTGGLIFVLFALVQSSGNASTSTQDFVLVTGVCSTPFLLVGLAAMGVGAYFFRAARNLTPEHVSPVT